MPDDGSGRTGAEYSLVCASHGRDIVYTLAARDYKGVSNEYISEGKVVVMQKKRPPSGDPPCRP